MLIIFYILKLAKNTYNYKIKIKNIKKFTENHLSIKKIKKLFKKSINYFKMIKKIMKL